MREIEKGEKIKIFVKITGHLYDIILILYFTIFVYLNI